MNNWEKELNNLLTKMSEEYLIDDEFGKQLEWFITNALNQQRSEVIREIKDNFRNDDFYNDDGSFKLGTFHSFLTKLEEEK